MPKQLGFPNRIAGILIRLTAAVQENEPDQRTDPGDGGSRAYILIASAKFGQRQLELSRRIKANQKRPNILNEQLAVIWAEYSLHRKSQANPGLDQKFRSVCRLAFKSGSNKRARGLGPNTETGNEKRRTLQSTDMKNYGDRRGCYRSTPRSP